MTLPITTFAAGLGEMRLQFGENWLRRLGGVICKPNVFDFCRARGLTSQRLKAVVRWLANHQFVFVRKSD